MKNPFRTKVSYSKAQQTYRLGFLISSRIKIFEALTTSTEAKGKLSQSEGKAFPSLPAVSGLAMGKNFRGRLGRPDRVNQKSIPYESFIFKGLTNVPPRIFEMSSH